MNKGGGGLAERGRGLLRPVFYLGNNRVSQVGVMVTTASAITLLTFYTTEFFGVHVSPYVGIITYLILPAVFVLGLLLIPLGIALRYRSEKLAGLLPTEYPRVDFADVRLRETFWFVVVMTGVNLALFLTATYRGVHYMDSVSFCGQTCHTVMTPEYTAYLNSPHARVACVECHIGPGAPWFVRSKISGSWQVIAVTFDLYPRPIPTPIENLRPSRETCEQCHWPLKFHNEKLVVKTNFAEDEQNTMSKTVLLMHTGGVDALTGKPQGNHGVHLQPGSAMQYVALDRERQNIPYVRYEKPDGEVIEYISDDAEQPLEALRAQPTRLMDCMDCHNRPTHVYEMPDRAVNIRMRDDLIDPSLPYVKKESMELLKKDYTSQGEAAEEIRAGLREFYQEKYPELMRSESARLEKAADALVDVYQRNVFPDMNISWGTYSNNLGHENFPGCFRCHDGLHSSPDGEHTIPNDCGTCHNLLAFEEQDPEVLASLGVD
jgi:hypothetical protein